jgi:DNA-binding CsgD family transcriptional regulator
VGDAVAGAPPALVHLLAVALVRDGADTHTAAHALGRTTEDVVTLLDSGRRSGLLGTGDRLHPEAVEAVEAAAGPTVLADVRRAVLEVELRRDTLSPSLALRLAAGGLRDPRLAQRLVVMADAEQDHDAAAAERLYSAGVRAGADPGAVAVRRARAATRAGDLESALEVVDAAWDRVPDDDLGALVRVGATVAVLRGMPRHAAALYRYLGPDRAGEQAHLGAAVLWGAGDAEGARAMAGAAPAGAPTTRAAGLELLAEGLELSMGSAAPQALATLFRSAALLHPADPTPTPVSGAAVAALAALHAGDLDRAEVVLRRAVADPAAPGPRRAHHLGLLAWTAMLRGDLPAADELRSEAAALGSTALRDELFARSLEVGLARRRGDLGALVASWSRAGEVLAELTPDLFTLLPLGELWVAAARVGDVRRLAPAVEEAHDLLRRLGEPVLWSSALHWSGVHAAILGEDPAELRPHAAALTAASHHSPYAAALATGGQAWLRVLVGRVDGAEVTAAAQGLARFGLAWDGSRLAGQAALRTADAATATDLLQVARTLAPSAGSALSAPGGSEPVAPGGALSDREREVAALVVEGLTYRDIGERLFISAKTVEHHVARVRRRLGAGSRRELLEMMRAAVGQGG